MGTGVTTLQAHAQPSASPPSLADVERITALADPVVRNLQITQCYFELSGALAARTADSANWCTFAVWASKQVGQTIRKEDLERTFEQLWTTSSELPAVTSPPGSIPHQVSAQLPESLLAAGRSVLAALSLDHLVALGDPLLDLAGYRHRIQDAVLAVSSFEHASEAAARGNRKVFEEIAWQFARFLATVADDTVADPARIAEFCATLRPGDPPDGQHYLIEAFTSYYQALFEPDPKARAELLLLANDSVGLHEQTRLEPEITAALDAPVVDPRELRRRLLEILLPELGWVARVRWSFASSIGLHDPFEAALSHLLAQAQLLGRVVITEHLMSLALPGGVRLKLGQDLRGPYPADLLALTNPELLTLLSQVDPTPNSLDGTAVQDWSDLPERMHFIVDMFRCFQEQGNLLSAPFSPDQVVELKAGRLPEGRL